MNKKTLKLTAIAVTMIVMVATSAFLINAGLAYQQWSKTFTFSIATESFKVYKDAACTQEWSSGSESLGKLSTGANVKTFYLKNDGDLTLTVAVTGESLTGAGNTKSWSATSITLNPGQSGSLTLTLNVQSSGSYTFAFTKT